MEKKTLANYINGVWQTSSASTYQNVVNPATGEVMAQVPLSPPQDVDQAASAAAAAAGSWRRVPATTRVQHLSKLKALLEENIDELSRTITNENGKTFAEARGEMVRAIENVDVACGIPILMQGTVSEDTAVGIDELI